MPTGPTGRRPIDDRNDEMLEGDADPPGDDAVRRWRAASADNERSLRSCERALEMERAAGEAMDVGLPPDARDVVWLAEARETARKLTRPTSTRASGRWWHAGLGVAAALVVALGGFLLRSVIEPVDPGLQVDMFLAGDEDLLKLTDGSVVRLAPGSRIRLLPESGARTVELDGRAYFAIRHDAERPFVVRTRAGDVRVLGTRFQAEAAGDSMRVLVIEGRVALSGISQETNIEASQVGTIKSGRLEPVVTLPNAGHMLDWMGDFIVFQATPLAAALSEIADRHGLRYEIVDTTYARRDLTMWFAGQRLDEIVDVICAVLGAECSVDSDVIRIGR